MAVNLWRKKSGFLPGEKQEIRVKRKYEPEQRYLPTGRVEGRLGPAVGQRRLLENPGELEVMGLSCFIDLMIFLIEL